MLHDIYAHLSQYDEVALTAENKLAKGQCGCQKDLAPNDKLAINSSGGKILFCFISFPKCGERWESFPANEIGDWKLVQVAPVFIRRLCESTDKGSLAALAGLRDQSGILPSPGLRVWWPPAQSFVEKFACGEIFTVPSSPISLC
jgi:hypothetical protein